MMEFRYNFPRMAGTYDEERMIGKLFEEAHEVESAWSRWKRTDRPSDYMEMATEVLDLLHACETFLRNMQLQDEDVCCLADKVKVKNATRGYYGLFFDRDPHDCPWWNGGFTRCDRISEEG